MSDLGHARKRARVIHERPRAWCQGPSTVERSCCAPCCRRRLRIQCNGQNGRHEMVTAVEAQRPQRTKKGLPLPSQGQGQGQGQGRGRGRGRDRDQGRSLAGWIHSVRALSPPPSRGIYHPTQTRDARIRKTARKAGPSRLSHSPEPQLPPSFGLLPPAPRCAAPRS